MMETVVGVSKQQPYSPHLKKVLKTYQLSAVKSLQGPSTLLGTPAVLGMDKGHSAPSTTTTVTVVSKKEPVPVQPAAPECGDVFMTPPPFPIQQLPILTTPDQSRSELSETVLEGETISCFVVGGEKRLCLPQVLNSVLREFSLLEINLVCEELQIFCSRCNPEQLEVLKVTGILPMNAPSCGLITKTDAERLSSALLHRRGGLVIKATGCHEGAFSFKVYHECFGKCKGICTPELYTDNNAHCIECVECHGMFSPQKFVCHVHRFRENRTCHWGFDSSNWRSYILIAKDQDEHEKLSKVLEKFKEQHDITANMQHHKRKQVHHQESDCKETPEFQVLKKQKLDVALDPYNTYVYPVADPSNHIFWYESWARMSAFRPWPSLLSKEVKGQPQPPPVFRDSLPTSVPAYLSHSPPVLLHPERVVPMSECERFERSFQPNVALAPIPQQRRTRLEVTKLEVKTEDPDVDRKSVCSKKSSASPVSPSSAVPVLDAHHFTAKSSPSSTATSAVPAAGGPTLYNPEIELSTDTEDSLSDVAGETALIGTESKTVVAQLVAVLDTLCDTKETARARVLGLVEHLAMRLEQQEAKCRQLREENDELQRLHRQQQQRHGKQEERIAELQRRLRQEDIAVKQDPDAFQDKMVVREKELRTICSEVSDLSGSSLVKRAKEPVRSSSGGSPVSVITSQQPVIPLVIKSEPNSSE